MPKETFFNLNDDKQNLIYEIALKEFAINDYNSASINSIVKKADISKGSMYQYFDNKNDLYMYLLNTASEKKLNYIRDNISGEDKSFFEMIKEIHLVGAKFDLTHPKYSKMIINAMNENIIEGIGDISFQLKNKSDDFFENYIIKGQQQNNIRNDIDSSFLSFLISRTSISLIDFISKTYNFSYRELINENKKEMPIEENELEEILEDYISVLKKGIKIYN